MTATQPNDPPWFHLLNGTPPAVFVVPGSMLFDIDMDTFSALEQGDPVALAQLRALAPPAPIVGEVLAPVTALSLNVAQACNLACTYCYADKGKFGTVARLMDDETAFRGIDQLIAGAAGRHVTVGFIGGEPFLNRRLVHACVAHARNAARDKGIAARFAVTTNATLLHAEDISLLRENAFAVTVSIDGGPNQNRHRPAARGAQSTEAVLAGIAPLLGDPGRARVAARATVTRDDLDIANRVEDLIAVGFQEIGVSPARTSARGDLALTQDDWPVLLENMIDAAQRELARIASGEPPRFSNFWVGLRSIHRGAARALPCGSVATYLSLDADGAFYSCHRTVNKPGFRMGSLEDRVDMSARQTFLEQASVDRQTPCKSCWARYLCGGGCHAEVAATGRPGCDFIRGWLEFCLRSYRLVADRYPALLLRGHA
ncbi:radical SAM protein [Paraburkholderia fungorum]|uniref:radical SAM protein n=1 Tax=Paraburkholderia fungorum TaxID=134537 RepID=UPI0038B9C8B6